MNNVYYLYENKNKKTRKIPNIKNYVDKYKKLYPNYIDMFNIILVDPKLYILPLLQSNKLSIANNIQFYFIIYFNNNFNNTIKLKLAYKYSYSNYPKIYYKHSDVQIHSDSNIFITFDTIISLETIEQFLREYKLNELNKFLNIT
jgi:hypothetical protein